jgi:hypothetical protein
LVNRQATLRQRPASDGVFAAFNVLGEYDGDEFSYGRVYRLPEPDELLTFTVRDLYPLRQLAAEDAILRFEEFDISHEFRLRGSGTVRAPRPLKS